MFVLSYDLIYNMLHVFLDLRSTYVVSVVRAGVRRKQSAPQLVLTLVMQSLLLVLMLN